MTHMHVYLSFNGNCREAMRFYQTCLGGTLQLQTIGESPLAEQMPKQMKDCILHATLTQKTWVLQGSDLLPESGLNQGNSLSLVLACSSEAEIRKLYAQLSANGIANQPLAYTHWGALFGNLTDKYGNHWLLNYTKKDTDS